MLSGTATVVLPWTILDVGSSTRGNDPSNAFLRSIGEASVDLNQGGLRLSQALDFDQSPGTAVGGSPALVYNSSTVSVRPIIQLQVQTDPTLPAPTSAQITLTFNGVPQAAVVVPLMGVQPGQALTVAVQVDNAVTATGLYNWSATLVFTIPGHANQQVTKTGTAAVVVRDGSAYGAGWGLDGVSQLVSVTGGVLWVTGAGDSRFFAEVGGVFSSPAEDFGSLVQNPDHSYTYTAKDETAIHFNAAGYQTSVVDTDGQVLSYSYDTQNRLIGVLAPDGGLTTLAYDPGSGLLSSITEPGGRVLSFQHDLSGNLSFLTDAAGFTRTLGYDLEHHATSDQWAPYNALFSYDPSSGLLSEVDQGLGSVWTISAAAAQGLTFGFAGPAWASLTDGNTHTTQYLLDDRGRLLEQVQPDGATDTYFRDAAGQVTEAINPLNVPTFFSYVYGAYNATLGGGAGDLVQTTYADGSFDSTRYDAVFHEVTQTNNTLGEVSGDTYNPITGDLLSSTDAMKRTTTDVWVNGLLMSSTDALGITTYNVYDSDRRLAVSYDGMGVPTYYLYDAAGNPSVTLDALGRPTQTLFNGDNELVQTVDANGGVTSQTYDASGDQTSDTNARGFTETTTFDQRGFSVQSTDYTGTVTDTKQYDPAGNLLVETDAKGNPTTFSYDADNRQTSSTDAMNFTDTTAYDKAGDVTATTDTLGRTTTSLLDVMGRVAETIDPMLRKSFRFFDAAGNDVWNVDAMGFSTFNFVNADNETIGTLDAKRELSQSVEDADGNVVATIDPLKLGTVNLLDADNRVVSSTDASGATTRTVYDVLGEVVQSIDARGKITRFSYDNVGQQIGTLDPTGDLTQTVRDAAGNAIETIDARGKITFDTFDADTRVVKDVNPDGNTSTFQFDAAGNDVADTDPNGKTTYNFFDADNRNVLTLDANNHFQQTVFDAASQAVARIDGFGNVTQTGFNNDGEAVASLDGNSKMTLSQVNANGQQVALTDPDTNTTRFALDPNGNVVATIDPLNKVTVQTLDADGRVTSTTDALGRTRTFAYDNDGRVLTETWYNADHTVADILSYTYDTDGNVLTASNKNGTYRFSYDDSGRLLTRTDPFGLTLTYAYDNDGNVASVTDSLGGVVSSVYDNAGQLTSRLFSGPNGQQARLDLTYTPDGQVATLTRYSDLAGTHKVGFSQFSYDPAGNVVQIQHQDGLGNVLDNRLYSYDSADRLVSQTVNGVATIFNYDRDSQLVGAGIVNYSYDPNGNRNLPGYVTGPNNQLLSDGTWNYSYDAAGNTIGKTNIQTGETWAYSYDLNNKLTLAVHKDAAGTLIESVTLSYDVFGQLVEEDVYEAGTNQTTVSKYAWDGQGNVWADLNGSGQLVMRRVYLDGPNQPMLRIDASGNVSWYLADHLGSIVGITNASGGLIDQKAYDVWGNLTSETQPANGDRYGYAGMQFDPVQSDYYDNARRYRPSTGTFTSIDPLGFGAGDPNERRYVGNSPTNGTDPSGEIVPLLVVGAAAAGFWLFGPGAGDVQAPTRPGEHVVTPLSMRWKDDIGAGLVGAASLGGVAAAAEATPAIVAVMRASAPVVKPVVLAVEIKASFDKVKELMQRGRDAEAKEEALKAVVGLLEGPLAKQRITALLLLQKAIQAKDFGTAKRLLQDQALAEVNLALDELDACQGGLAGALGKSNNAVKGALAVRDMFAAAKNRDLGKFAAAVNQAIDRFGKACFVAGTPLLTPHGAKPIEQFQPGDWVLAAPENDPTGPIEPRQVEEVFVRTAAVLHVHVGGQIIRTTAEHPFWVWGKAWMAAKDLEAGDRLRSHDGKWVAVGAATDSGDLATVYNVRVAEYHTYFVGCHEWGFSVWAHNSNLCIDGSFFGKTPERVREAIPKGWAQRKAASGHGWVLVDETGAERVRYMYPDKNGKFHHETTGYFRRNDAAGNFLDVDGKIVDPADPLFHVKTHIIPSGAK